MGSPNFFSYGFLGFPNSYPGSMGFPMPFSAFPRRLSFANSRITSLRISCLFSAVEFGVRVHGLDIGDTSRFTVFFAFLSPRNSRPASCSEELSNFFELARPIIDQDAQPSPGTGLLENSKDTQFTQRKKGISRRQKRNLFPPPPRCTRKLSNDATVDLLSNCDDTDGD